MDFGLLPPEVNSARMYAGPGSGPMLTAAMGWDSLAAELHTTAMSYQSVISQLTSGPWLGPASTSMAAAVAPFIAWLHTTAGHAEQSASQARAAAGAYESARAMTVPPPVIAANRALLMSLVSTNVLGQNTPAIAATEFHYGQMWAQDAAAMYGYAASSAMASMVTPFTPAPPTTNPTGAARQGAAVAKAAGDSAGTQMHTILSTSAIPRALQALASPSSPLEPAQSILDSLSGHTRTVASSLSFLVGAAGLARSANIAGATGGASVQTLSSAAGVSGSAGLSGLRAGAGGAMSAALGRGTSVGALSVPQSWVAASPVISPVAVTTASIGSSASPVVAPTGVPLMPMAPMTGRGAARVADAARFLLRPNMVPQWPVGG
ncbi:hypothetical protein A5707_17655 [Mycobacterium kyorinense]|uniref:PPE family protein n=1 Tax=Mycobacterium kyorinense TaxID=487514 RepID=A0A1A2ZG55_9MYCO|nr:PPE family protein [Mycobacterium kyorinense]OBI48643.1 hypothetical protein A5707_17655 [Mycobacterium kyorinense]